jgi:hypothetical protein
VTLIGGVGWDKSVRARHYIAHTKGPIRIERHPPNRSSNVVTPKISQAAGHKIVCRIKPGGKEDGNHLPILDERNCCIVRHRDIKEKRLARDSGKAV